MNTSFTLHDKQKAKLCWESVTEENRAQQDKTHSCANGKEVGLV